MSLNQNLSNLMKEAEKMQKRMQEAQEQLKQLEEVGRSGGGLVEIFMSGAHYVSKVVLKPSLMEEDINMVCDLIAAAINDAVRKVEKTSKDKISQLTAGLNIPTNFLQDEDEEK